MNDSSMSFLHIQIIFLGECWHTCSPTVAFFEVGDLATVLFDHKNSATAKEKIRKHSLAPFSDPSN